jgi:hypothetical protein
VRIGAGNLGVDEIAIKRELHLIEKKRKETPERIEENAIIEFEKGGSEKKTSLTSTGQTFGCVGSDVGVIWAITLTRPLTTKEGGSN